MVQMSNLAEEKPNRQLATTTACLPIQLLVKETTPPVT